MTWKTKNNAQKKKSWSKGFGCFPNPKKIVTGDDIQTEKVKCSACNKIAKNGVTSKFISTEKDLNEKFKNKYPEALLYNDKPVFHKSCRSIMIYELKYNKCNICQTKIILIGENYRTKPAVELKEFSTEETKIYVHEYCMFSQKYFVKPNKNHLNY